MATGDKLVTLDGLKSVYDHQDVDTIKEDVSDLQSAIQQKITEPQTDGTNGQVLTTDGNGGRSWTTVQGGGSSDVSIMNTTASSDLDLTDSNGYVVARFAGGHVQTKNFDSADVTSLKNSEISALEFCNIFSGHFLYHHMTQEASNPFIPAESLYDIRYAHALGFNMIEANTQKLSDDVFVVKHGGNDGSIGAGVKDAIGSADYSSVKWEDITSTWLRTNVRYNARQDKFCGYIPTLDEFCKECAHYGMMVKVSSIEAAMVARKYMPDSMIWATLWNPAEGRGEFKGTVEYVWFANADIDDTIDACKAIKPPLNIVISGYLSNRTDAEIAEMTEKAHANGFTVGAVYPTPADILRAMKLGVDCAGSTNKSVNLFSNGNAKHIVNLNDSNITLSTGATYDSTTDTISMASGSSIYCSGDIKRGKGCLILRYSGTLTITIGSTNESAELRDYVSDGADYVFLSNVLSLDTSNYDKWFNISADASTTIYELSFDGEFV